MDAFFPLIDLIEAEFKDISAFLADPLKELENSPTSAQVRRRSVQVTKRRAVWSLPVLHFTLPEKVAALLPQWLVQPRTKVRVQQLVLDDKGNLVPSSESPVPLPSTKARKYIQATHKPTRKVGKLISHNLPFSPAEVLHRMAQSRKLVVGILRLIAAKTDVTRAMRKRSGHSDDIAVYFGDLEGESARVSTPSRTCRDIADGNVFFLTQRPHFGHVPELDFL